MSVPVLHWIPWAYLLLAVAASACVDYGTREPDCQDKACQATCASDPDCPAGHECVFFEDGCCSRCQPIGCLTDADCPVCEVCDPGRGECLATPCAHECDQDTDCAPDERCEFDARGCCGHCLPVDPCAGLDCVATCVVDEECAPGASCHIYEDGCCSMCLLLCDVCSLSAGEYCPLLTDAPCEDAKIEVIEQGPCAFRVTYTGADGVDVVWIDGCHDHQGNLPVNGCGYNFSMADGLFRVACDWCGQVLYSPEYCECQPTCGGRQCGPDGCGGVCGQCPAGCRCGLEGHCTDCPGDEVLLVPACVHAPRLVTAGGDFPLAVFGPLGCAWFDRLEVAAAGFDIRVRLIGVAEADPHCPQLINCTAEDWAYIGLVWLPAPNPGGYRVMVSDSVVVTVGASGGIIEDPVCQDNCPPPDLGAYSWSLVSRFDWPLSASCGDFRNDGRPVQFEGQCQDYTVQAEYWPFPTDVHHCTDDWLYFGAGPFFRAEASVCQASDPTARPRLLGIGWLTEGGAQHAEAFLIEGR